ncbi:MAG TPA: DNA repair protein RecO [Polyangiaceae bacterium]|nr:DNA repair protein RecO [Polyangiaceae bacterium]
MTTASSAEVEVEGLLLSRIAYGEADWIVHVFTDRLGKLAALARGARRSQKRFAGALEPLHTLTLRLSARPHGELYTLREAGLARMRLPLLSDLGAMETAGRALGWVKRASPAHTPEPLVWSALLSLLDELEKPERADADSLSIAFGVQLLEGLGWGLDLTRCVSCGKICPAGQAAWIHPQRGGLICRACGGGPLLLPGELRNRLATLTPGLYPSFQPHSALGLSVVERALEAHPGG